MSHVAPSRPRRHLWITAGAVLTALVAIAAVGLVGLTGRSTTSAPADATGPTTAQHLGHSALPQVHNVVLILADDLDSALFDQVPRLKALEDKGTTFTNFTVTDSLCCPSRTSIFRSQYIHNHHVISNVAATGGGWGTFEARGEQNDCLPVWLHNAGIHTGLYGKYLNEFPGDTTPADYVPPGWDAFGVPTSKLENYTGYNYQFDDNGTLEDHGSAPADFLNDVVTAKSTDFIRTAPDGFFLELASYNPHRPAPVAERNKATHPDTIAPRTPNYNALGTNEPSWLAGRPLIRPSEQAALDLLWRQRAQSAESVADSVDAVMSTLQATGHADDTLVIVTADNGYHAGSHRMTTGKRTAFREDTVVPMVAIGPGVKAGARIDAMTSTIDLGPTFADVLGATTPTWVDGRSLTPLLASGTAPTTWRTGVLSENLGTSNPGDPDYEPGAPPQFTALRTQDWLYVKYDSGERELYDLRADPWELDNIVGTADPNVLAALDAQLTALSTCSGDSCRVADSMTVPPPGSGL